MISAPVIRAMYCPKVGADESEWEDAAAYSEQRGIAAVADGASSSYRAGRWAAALAQGFVSDDVELRQGPSPFTEWVSGVGGRFQGASEGVSEGSWYAADASTRGSFATFCGLRLYTGKQNGFISVAVGDACAFHSRGHSLVTASTEDPEGFDSTPDLLSSQDYDGSNGATQVTMQKSVLRGGDVVFLATDALAASMLRLAAAGQAVWEHFAAIGQRGFDVTVDALRSQGVMEDDDVTLVRVRIPQDWP